jgi:putative flippase GtrA
MKRPASLICGIILLIFAFLQLIRYTFAVPVEVNGLRIPIWVSAVIAIIFGTMAFWLFNERKNDSKK